MSSFVPRDAFVLKIRRELYHPKCARNVSGLSRNGPLAPLIRGRRFRPLCYRKTVAISPGSAPEELSNLRIHKQETTGAEKVQLSLRIFLKSTINPSLVSLGTAFYMGQTRRKRKCGMPSQKSLTWYWIQKVPRGAYSSFCLQKHTNAFCKAYVFDGSGNW